MVRSGNILELIERRQSTRTSFDSHKKVKGKDVSAILESARWSPTAHNMQNFEIVVVDDPAILRKIGKIKSRISEAFLRENYKQLSFSKEELLKKRVGILGENFPPSWKDPHKLRDVAKKGPANPLDWTVQGAPVVLIVIYDPRKRAPASKGDFLGIMSLGCVMENMWLVAESLGISFQVMSVFGGDQVEKELKRILQIPAPMEIAYAVRLGYPSGGGQAEYLRVRRNPESFAHYNRY